MVGSQLAKASVAIVTGVGQGLGKAIVLKLASQAYSTVLGDLPSNKHALLSVQQECSEQYKELPNKPALTSVHMPCDVTIEPQVNELVNGTVDRFGKLDVMIANAGVVKLASLLELSTHDFDKTCNVDIKGLFLSYRAAASVMIPTGGGRIIGACSSAGKTAAKEEKHLIDEQVLQLTPTGRKSTKEEVAGLVAFLVSPAAQNITGQCISIDGGFTMN